MSTTTFTSTTNFYEVLGVKQDATQEEVRKAYRRRALQTHPDRLPQDVSQADKKKAEEQFRLVNNAYEVLNNEESRKLYDKHGVWPPPTEQPEYQPLQLPIRRPPQRIRERPLLLWLALLPLTLRRSVLPFALR
ncbi:hypothetical protein NUW54_g8810 [Trametes sanguinea]|uniref:Uncharacterized protein n=1 Tax=Trametes sanguinea TaxID=158606 RepID=A0ACC1PDB6_9APHY|nr:hypothetical protein NUW54_g8810 [Trametes sanguinea]